MDSKILDQNALLYKYIHIHRQSDGTAGQDQTQTIHTIRIIYKSHKNADLMQTISLRNTHKIDQTKHFLTTYPCPATEPDQAKP